MQQAGVRGGRGPPPQILADQKAPPGSGGAPHYYLPHQFEEAIKAPVVPYVQSLAGHAVVTIRLAPTTTLQF